MATSRPASKEGLSEFDQAPMARLEATARSPEALALVDHVARRIEDLDGQRRTLDAKAGLRRAVGAFLADLSRACRSSDDRGWVYRPLDPKYFTGQPVSYRTFKGALSGFDGLGLMEVVAPRSTWETVPWADGETVKLREGKATRFRAAPRLIHLAADMGVQLENLRHHFHRPLPDRLITLKTASSWVAGEKYDGEHLDFADAPQVEAIRAEVGEINRFLEGVRIDGAHHDGFHRGFCKGDHPDFAWNKGGRLYSSGRGHYQQLSKARRAEITLDGEAVAEIDVRASYLTILHGITQTPMDLGRDPYDVPGISRDIAKRWMVTSMGQAKPITRWPRGKTVGDPESTGSHPSATEVGKAMTQRFPVLMELENRQVDWADLMFLESQAIIGTMKALMHEGVPALPVHDSIMVPSSKMGMASKALTRAYEAVAGIKPTLAL